MKSKENNIWLPYTQMKHAPELQHVVGAKGMHLQLRDGRELLDGIASWWSVCHGYQHPQIVEAMQQQLGTLAHVMFAGVQHDPADQLAENLVRITPEGLNKVFFSDSGSTAVEVAMKIALQFWSNQEQKQKSKFIAFSHSYHGDTMGAMSVSDPDKGMHSPYHHAIPKQYCLQIPNDEYSLAECEYLVEQIADTAAAMIIEPLMQGAGGLRFYSADILAALHKIAKKHDILFIADEVATGFGRLGYMFACEEAGITPDIMCLGKALTAGMVPLAATMATSDVFNAFLSDSLEHALMHGPTFMANPLACAVANASIAVFDTEPRLQQVAEIEEILRTQLATYADHPKVKQVRCKGAVGVVELQECSWEQILKMREMAVAQGVWLRPFGKVIYITPPFIATEEDLTILCNAIGALLEC